MNSNLGVTENELNISSETKEVQKVTNNEGTLTPPLPIKADKKFIPKLIPKSDQKPKVDNTDNRKSSHNGNNNEKVKSSKDLRRGEWDMFAEQNDFDASYDVKYPVIFMYSKI